MSKSEYFAYQKYPQSKKGVLYDLARNSIIQGYRQAEKDLKLTWQDIVEIESLLNLVMSSKLYKNGYKEVLKRFKNYKESNENG